MKSPDCQDVKELICPNYEDFLASCKDKTKEDNLNYIDNISTLNIYLDTSNANVWTVLPGTLLSIFVGGCFAYSMFARH